MEEIEGEIGKLLARIASASASMWVTPRSSSTAISPSSTTASTPAAASAPERLGKEFAAVVAVAAQRRAQRSGDGAGAGYPPEPPRRAKQNSAWGLREMWFATVGCPAAGAARGRSYALRWRRNFAQPANARAVGAHSQYS